jgi:hypothetical protein
MFIRTKIPTETNQIPIEDIDKPRKPYCKPLLETLDDLRTLTLGGSPGMGDSGPNYYSELFYIRN